MISDEMRELLSAYVDGELRDADAARVEDVSKRDPELRREIEAYRTLRRKLREWDEAEHGAAPSPAFMTRALARARTVDTALAVRVPAPSWRPLAMAAGLLLAVGAGYWAARSTAPGAPPVPSQGTTVAVKPLEPAPDLSLEGSALAPKAPAATDLVHRMRIYDHIPSRRAVELEDLMRQEDLLVSKPPEPGRTEPRVTAEIRAMIGGFAPGGQPSEALVVLSRPPDLNVLVAVEPPTGRAMDPSSGRIMLELMGKGPDVLAPLGEVWVGTDGTRRTRIVAPSGWAGRNWSNFLTAVWADETRTPTHTADVEAQGFILGPKARQKLLLAQPGSDAAFLAWLRENYGRDPLPVLLAEGVRDRDRAVNKLVDALGRDVTATGFAVFDATGKFLGAELFLDHDTMLAFAPRLLRGYLFEAGEDGIRVLPPRGAGRGPEVVQNLLDGMPGRGLRVERQRLDKPATDHDNCQAPAGVARVTFLTTGGVPVGHGIVRDDTPIHLTLFGE